MTRLYLLFLIVATLTVLTPGPGVVMTLTNTLRFGLKHAVGGIFGIATGTLIVAALSATGLGILLSTSATAFAVIKLIGAVYLIYLGLKLWRAPHIVLSTKSSEKIGVMRLFGEGISLQLTNPKAIFFFLSVLPQFIDANRSNILQFAFLVLTYSSLVVIIHCLYGVGATHAKQWLNSERGGKALNRIGAVVFMLFGVVLGGTSR